MCQVTFIRKQTLHLQEPGSPVHFTRYTEKELVELVRSGDAPFFSVPESHAIQVLRKNPAYQEVDMERINVLATKVRKPRRKSGAD